MDDEGLIRMVLGSVPGELGKGGRISNQGHGRERITLAQHGPAAQRALQRPSPPTRARNGSSLTTTLTRESVRLRQIAAMSIEHGSLPDGCVDLIHCIKVKTNNSLGKGSICDRRGAVITCSVRYHEEWLIAEEAVSSLKTNRRELAGPGDWG